MLDLELAATDIRVTEAMYDAKLTRLLAETDEDGKQRMIALFRCFAYCGDGFIQEIREAHTKGKEAMLAVIAKWEATIPAELAT